MGRLVLMAALLTVAVGVGGCTRTPARKPLPIEQRITMAMEKFHFTPGSFEVMAGKRVTLRIKSNDVAYGFAIPALDLRATVPAKGETTLNFLPDRKGSYVFRCTPPGPQPGCREMRGVMTVK